MDNFRGFLGIGKMEKVLNAQIKELCRVMKRVNGKIDESVFRFIPDFDEMLQLLVVTTI